MELAKDRSRRDKTGPKAIAKALRRMSIGCVGQVPGGRPATDASGPRGTRRR